MYFEDIPNAAQRRKISLCEAQNWRCCYCKLRVEFISRVKCLITQQNGATFEHYRPKARGGTYKDKNIIIARLLCNKVRNLFCPVKFERTILRLLKNPNIRAAWHKFTLDQIKFLREEIEFADIKRKAEKKAASQELKRIYRRMLQDRLWALNLM